MRLSALAVRNAKSREKPCKLGDGGGLYLLVKPSGTRLWRMNCSYMGRQNTLSLAGFSFSMYISPLIVRRRRQADRYGLGGSPAAAA